MKHETGDIALNIIFSLLITIDDVLLLLKFIQLVINFLPNIANFLPAKNFLPDILPVCRVFGFGGILLYCQSVLRGEGAAVLPLARESCCVARVY